MLKNILLVSLVALAWTQPVFGQSADSNVDYSSKKMNIRGDLGSTLLFMGTQTFGTSLGFDAAVTPNLSLGVMGTFAAASYKIGDENLTGVFYTLGLRLQYFTEKVFTNSWYFAPSVSYITGSIFRMEVTAGYMWTFPSGLNLQLGIGPAIYFGGLGSLFLPTLDMSIGYLF